MIYNHSFAGGLNFDHSPLSTPQGTLADATNISIITDQGKSTLAVQNIKGNIETPITDAEDAAAYDREGYVIINITPVREDFVVFYAKGDNSGYGIIDKLVRVGDSFVRVELYKTVDFNTLLDFIPNMRLAVEVHYTSDEVIRLHFTTLDYPIRLINVGCKRNFDKTLEASYTLKSLPVKVFSRLPYDQLKQPEFVDYGFGSLRSGSYQYAYRLLTVNGAYSQFSPASKVINLSPTGSNSGYTIVKGADTSIDSTSGLSNIIRVNLTDLTVDENPLDLSYIERIEIVSLYYSASTDVPTISIIEQINNPSNSFLVVDETNEAKYGTISYIEYTNAKYNIAADTLASKDGVLFAGNITEYGFDVNFDARAFRFDSSNECIVEHENVPLRVEKTGSWPTATYTIDSLPIPENYDLINPYNTDKAEGYKYLNDGGTLTLGGEGPNVMYTFERIAYSINSSTTGERSLVKGFKQGEVIRFSSVFYSENGLKSPAKWIGDIRIPDYDEIGTYSGTLNNYVVCPRFFVNTAGTGAQGYSYQIFYQPLDAGTRRILTEGFSNQIVREINDNTASYVNPFARIMSVKDSYLIQDRTDTMTGLSGYTTAERPAAYYDRYLHIPNLVALHSPELLLGKQFPYKNNIKAEFIGYVPTGVVPYTQEEGKYADFILKAREFVPYLGTSVDLLSVNILNYKSSVDVGGELVRSFNDNTSGANDDEDEDEWHWYAGTCLILERTVGDAMFPNLPNTDATPIIRLYRNITPYNGDTYNDRLLATYIPASDIAYGGNTLLADRGEVVTSSMECFNTFVTENGNYTRNTISVLIWPIQSYINADYRYDKSFFTGGGNVKGGALWPHFIQETGNVTGDLYKYDNTYSTVDKSSIAIAVDEDFEAINHYDYKVIYSDTSTDDLKVDAWSIFRTNNYRMLRGELGGISKLIEFNDRIYSFQVSGLSVLSINPRITQVDEDGVTTVLGTGETLEKAIYISTEVGTTRYSDVVKSVQALYFLDPNKGKLYRATSEGLDSLSDTRSISSYILNSITKDSKLIGIYDNKYAMVYLTIRDFTLVFEDVENEYDQEVTTITVTPEIAESTYYTKSYTEIPTTSIIEDTVLRLTLDGTLCIFTCVAVVVDPLTEFLYNADPAIVATNLKTAIVNKLADLGADNLYSISSYTTTVKIGALVEGTQYDLNPILGNFSLGSQGFTPVSNQSGQYTVANLTTVTEDGTYVLVDFSTAGGVDRLDLYKNGEIVAQSGAYQGSNYGYPDVAVTLPKRIDRSNVLLKEYYQGTWSNVTSYTTGELVTRGVEGVYYVALQSTTGNIPESSPTYWQANTVGSFNTQVYGQPPLGTTYDLYCYEQAFVGTNSYLMGGTGTGSTTGYIPTRYADFLAETGIASEDWLGAEDDEVLDGMTVIGIVKDGVVSHYNGIGYDNARGQRIWARYNAGDTFEAKAMGSVAASSYSASYFVLEPSIENLEVYYKPSTEVVVGTTVINSTTTVETITVKKSYTTSTATLKDNRLGTLTLVSGTTYSLTGLIDLYRISYNTLYEINGGVFRVANDGIDYENNIVTLELVEGTVEEEGVVDLSQFMIYRNPFTITFSEIIDKFVSFHSFIPIMYTKSADTFLTVNDDYIIHTHNIGTYGEYYGTLHNCYIDVLLHSQSISRFTNIVCQLWANKGSEVIDKCPYSVKVFTHKQESDEIVLYPKSETRYVRDDDTSRLPNGGISTTQTIDAVEYELPYGTLYNTSKSMENEWRMAIPRIGDTYYNTPSITGVNPNNGDRALGSYAIVRLTLKNEDNIKQVLDALRFKFNTLSNND